MKTINCHGKLLDLSSPKIMGILNMTPDSFYDGGIHNDLATAIEHAQTMKLEGADLIDVGGMSSRPGAKILDTAVEMARVVPLVKALKKENNELIISVDTIRSEVAHACIEEGADIINDISAGTFDKNMFNIVSASKTPLIMMHMDGIPENMQDDPRYGDVTGHIIQYFINRLEECSSLGLHDIIIDPGFGFGKSIRDNYKLLNDLDLFGILDKPVLAGISRKSMIYTVLNKGPEESLSGTIAAQMVALQKGASILRVHDVKAARDTITIWNQLTMS